MQPRPDHHGPEATKSFVGVPASNIDPMLRPESAPDLAPCPHNPQSFRNMAMGELDQNMNFEPMQHFTAAPGLVPCPPNPQPFWNMFMGDLDRDINFDAMMHSTSAPSMAQRHATPLPYSSPIPPQEHQSTAEDEQNIGNPVAQKAKCIMTDDGKFKCAQANCGAPPFASRNALNGQYTTHRTARTIDKRKIHPLAVCDSKTNKYRCGYDDCTYDGRARTLKGLKEHYAECHRMRRTKKHPKAIEDDDGSHCGYDDCDGLPLNTRSQFKRHYSEVHGKKASTA